MSIETICKGCARKLRVADEHAGKTARCPHCRTTFTVPFVERGGAEVERWRVRTEDGDVYGPVAKSELDAWLAEGRIDANCQLQQDGDLQWRPASQMYPLLAAGGEGKFGDRPTVETEPLEPSNPYAPPASRGEIDYGAAGFRFGRRLKPHRGGLILTMGIFGLLCCQGLAVFAWVMGHSDLNAMRMGRMDPAGRGVTKAGMILGIIGTVLLILNVAARVARLQ